MKRRAGSACEDARLNPPLPVGAADGVCGSERFNIVSDVRVEGERARDQLSCD